MLVNEQFKNSDHQIHEIYDQANVTQLLVIKNRKTQVHQNSNNVPNCSPIFA